MSAAGGDRALFATAASCAALVFVVVASSAWLRIAAAPCPPGGCEGFGLADAVRLSHRVAAMGVSVLAIVIAALAWKSPARPGRRAAAAVIVVLVAALAIVGRRSAGAAPPAVVIANLLGGLALLGVAVGMAANARAPRGSASTPVALAAALLAAATATGAVLAAAPDGDASLGLAHQALAWVAAASWAVLAAGARAPGPARTAIRVAAALVAAGIVLALASSAGPLARWLHNLLASAALCAAIAAAFLSRDAARRRYRLPRDLPVRP